MNNLIKSKHILFVFISLILLGCSNNPESYIKHIEGYWEIEKVTMANGNIKEYKYNETIDYIRINDSLKGFRKKLKPGINDTYYTSDDAETVELKIENNKLNIYYTTPYAKWNETVLEANEDLLKVINKDENVYLYKRYTPIKLDLE